MSHGSVARKRYRRIGQSEPFDTPCPGLTTGHQNRRPLARNETCSIVCDSPDRIPSANKEGTCHPTSVAAAASQQTAGCAIALPSRCIGGDRKKLFITFPTPSGKLRSSGFIGAANQINGGANVMSSKC